jgi:hypothetical protein
MPPPSPSSPGTPVAAPAASLPPLLAGRVEMRHRGRQLGDPPDALFDTIVLMGISEDNLHQISNALVLEYEQV